jgi:hypothetical protein
MNLYILAVSSDNIQWTALVILVFPILSFNQHPILMFTAQGTCLEVI